MISVHPARWCTSPLGVVPAGVGDGHVGHCLDVAKGPKGVVHLFPWCILFWGNNIYSFFKSLWFFFTAGYASSYSGCPPHATMMHIRWAPLNGHHGGKAGKSTVGPRFPPLLDVSFW